MTNSYTRQELYELVWSEPIQTLSPRYGISNVAVAKTCRRHDIPLPPRGYWARVAAGQKVSRPPLPARRLGMPEVVRIGGADRWPYYAAPNDLMEREIPPPPTFTETVEELSARARKLVSEVSLPKLATKPHRFIASLLAADEERRRKQLASTYRSSLDNPLFGSPFERRRLRLVNAIFIALEKYGFTPSLRGKDPSEFGIRIGEEHVSFFLDDPKNQTQYPHQQLRQGYRNDSELNRPASDKLRMQIGVHRRIEGITSVSEDGPTGTIEGHLEEMAVNLIVAGELQYRAGEIGRHKWLVERKAQLIEEARKRKEDEERLERERRIKAEKARVDRLLGEAAALRQANDIRAYTEAVRAKNANSSNPVSAEEIEAWASWALAQADRIDPVLSRKFLFREGDEQT